ncbi:MULTISPECIES: nuclear transport factor 2 family protein [unclassified Bradyrhizobium]|uniref:nuclear transport factor 2 family protein n=1 Tax=unclassified Bradyrhizobium TaxID=2631580 RepID=UPI0020B31FCA|nr:MULTISPECIES: nuclear transport factor 2 family protein [unclassified Bradyrhizobium]MCP3385174.1 nuclear transport factor 2 family protein [Bradyrhizobium sp. CCGUVB4N]MCP3446438.1 nuclear transport factor 2 family protein [Bradyrhizobium sp. CCGUVB14]
MTESPDVAPLLEAVERYFKLMYDNDVSQFDRVFALTAQLHGFRDAELRILPAADYRRMLASTPSPQSRNAQRLQEILLLDLASPAQALVKVRVRIDVLQYIDYLAFHRISGIWLITAKSFYIERRYEPTTT